MKGIVDAIAPVGKASTDKSRKPAVMKLVRSRLNLIILLSALISLSALTYPQQTQSQGTPPVPQPSATPPRASDDEVLRINTNLIQIDAVVTDKHGRHISDLTGADFEIVEAGRVITPEYFSYVPLDSRGIENRATGLPPASDTQRVFAFVVSNPIIDFSFSLPGANGGPPVNGSVNTQVLAIRGADSARSLLTWFVDEQMTNRDLTAIADADVDIGVLSSFTNDRALLHAAIKQVRENASNGRSPSIRVMQTSGGLVLQALVKQNLRMIGTLESVVAQLERIPGRKIVTLVARGLLYDSSFLEANVVRERIERLSEKANRARIAIYTLQLKDLSPQGGNYGNDGLIHLAKETGGRAIFNTNDLRDGFANIVEENRGYYTLAYNAGPETQRRPHALKIRVKRDGLKVLARSQAFATGPQAQTVNTSVGATNFPFDLTEINVDLKPSLRNGAAPRIVASCTTDLTQVQSLSKGELQTFSLDMSIQITDPDGRLIKKADRRISFDVKNSELGATRGRLFNSEFVAEAANPGFYRLSFAVRDNNSGRMGSVTRFFEVSKSPAPKSSH